MITDSTRLLVSASVHADAIGDVAELRRANKDDGRCFTITISSSISCYVQRLFDGGNFGPGRAEIGWPDATTTVFLSAEQVAELSRKLDLLLVTDEDTREMRPEPCADCPGKDGEEFDAAMSSAVDTAIGESDAMAEMQTDDDGPLPVPGIPPMDRETVAEANDGEEVRDE